MAPLQVTVDAIALTDASAYRGMGTYVRQLVRSLALRDDVHLTAITDDASVLPAGIRSVTVRRAWMRRWQRAGHDCALPLALRRAAIGTSTDVVLAPAHVPPWHSPAPYVATIHDLVPLVDDDPGTGYERRALQRAATRYRKAAAIIAVSDHTREQAIALLDIAPERITTIHHGIDPAYTPGPSTGSPGDYLLMVGEVDPRKRHDRAFAIAGELARRGRPLPLKVTGRIAPWREAELRALVAAAPRPDLVELLGYVGKAELLDLYRGARALLVTSSHEGFGFPALEAMASGCPVVSFANSATPEVLGDAGIAITDGDIRAAADAVERVIDDAVLRAGTVAAGIAQATRFSWAVAADAHVDVLRRASQGAHGKSG